MKTGPALASNSAPALRGRGTAPVPPAGIGARRVPQILESSEGNQVGRCHRILPPVGGGGGRGNGGEGADAGRVHSMIRPLHHAAHGPPPPSLREGGGAA